MSEPLTDQQAALDRLQPLPNTAIPYSQEFLAYRHCVQMHFDTYSISEPFPGDPGYDAWLRLTDAASDVREQARRVILNRSVRTRRDFAELVLMVRQELWQMDSDGQWRAHSVNEELEDALMRGALVIVEGGAHV